MAVRSSKAGVSRTFDRVADTIRNAKGRVDVVVSAAGVTEQMSLCEITSEHYDRVFALNAKAPLFLVQKSLPMMTSGGSIILVSSPMHCMGLANHSAYARRLGMREGLHPRGVSVCISSSSSPKASATAARTEAFFPPPVSEPHGQEH